MRGMCTQRTVPEFAQNQIIPQQPDSTSTMRHHPLLTGLSFLQEGKIMPVKYEENFLIWVAVDQPVKDNSFLSSKVLELCGNLPIFWLKPMYPKGKVLSFCNWAWNSPCRCGSWKPPPLT